MVGLTDYLVDAVVVAAVEVVVALVAAAGDGGNWAAIRLRPVGNTNTNTLFPLVGSTWETQLNHFYSMAFADYYLKARRLRAKHRQALELDRIKYYTSLAHTI